jgi:hypothetical protein
MRAGKHWEQTQAELFQIGQWNVFRCGNNQKCFALLNMTDQL